MFPYVAAEQRRRAVHQRIFTAGRPHDRQAAISYRQPTPPRSELAETRRDEIGAQTIETAQFEIDMTLKTARQRFAAAAGPHPLPKMNVIEMLADIVDQTRRFLRKRRDADLLDCRRRQRRIF